jgi:SLT domain-containing protein
LVDPRLFDLLDRIIICESNYIATAANPNSSAKGIFQFISSTWDSWGEGDVLNAYDNIRAGVKLFKAKGVQPWLASKDCWK